MTDLHLSASGTSTNQERLSQLSYPGLLISGLPIIAVYPQGVNSGTRNGVWAGAPYSNTSVDDIQFVKDIINDISSAYCINPQKIFATGKSNGGGFTNLLACRPDTSNLFAGFGMMSPALYNETLAFSGCKPGRSGLPIITSHGVVDTTIPFYGRVDPDTGAYGSGTSTINVDIWRSKWALMNGCTSGVQLTSQNVTYPYSNTIEFDWTCPHAEVKAFTLQTTGHAWPTTAGLDTSGGSASTASFNMTSQQLVEFFSKQILPSKYLQ